MFKMGKEFGAVDQRVIKMIIEACQVVIKNAGKDCPPYQLFLNAFDRIATGKIIPEQNIFARFPNLDEDIGKETFEYAMAYVMVSAVIHHSLKNVTWEKFFPEYEVALTDFIKTMYEKKADRDKARSA